MAVSAGSLLVKTKSFYCVEVPHPQPVGVPPSLVLATIWKFCLLGLWLAVCRCAASSTIRRIWSVPVRPELMVKLSVMRGLAQLDLHLLSSEASVKQGYEKIAQCFVIEHSPETSDRLGSSAAR